MTLKRSTFASLIALAASVLASGHDLSAQAPNRLQRTPRRPAVAAPPVLNPAAAPSPPAAAPAAAAPAAPAAPGDATKPPGTVSLGDVQQHPEMTKLPKGLVDFTIEEGDLAELITTISTITGKRFIYGGKVRNIKVNIYAPKNQKITIAEAYQTFLSVLETNGLTVIPHGKFLKIVDSAGIATQTTPLYATGQPVPPDDRYVTRLYRLGHVSADEVNAILTKFKSKDADITVYPPGNLLIITDTAANIRRMLQLVEDIDVGGAGDQVWVEPIHYTTSTEMAQRINEIFDVKAAAAAAPGKPGSSTTSDTRITKIIAEDRTNSLIIVATERAYLRVLELIRRLDVPNTGEGEVHVLPLQHAMAEELAATLNTILTGAPAAAKGPPGAPGGTPAGIFEGSVKVTADKATNALVITSSLRDYGALRSVIDRLDMPRRQVFIEAVIMDLSVEHTNKLGVNYHGGLFDTPTTGALTYAGLNPLTTISPVPSADNLQGLALGVRGPGLAGTETLFGTGISIPAFGVVLNALATSGDANVLATPHIIATDNVAAEINVGENIPLQTNVGGLGSIPGLGAAGGAAAAALPALSGLGFGGGFSAPRQDVGTKIKVVPHINDSEEVRLELTEEISERGASAGTLGAVSITKRNAQTTVVVQDQQTVVIGGLMRDAVTTSDSKVPILGDIPVLGFLFRTSTKGTRKTNLLLILTPYVIRDQSDLRAVFERKMQERQEFLDRYFVFSDQKQYEPPRDYGRSNGLVEDIRQAYLGLTDRQRLEEETRPRAIRTHEAQQPIELPLVPSPGAAHRPPGAPASPAAPTAPAPPGAAPLPREMPPPPPGAAPAPAPAPGPAPGPAPPPAPAPAPPPPTVAPPPAAPQGSVPVRPGAPAAGVIVPPLGSLEALRALSPRSASVNVESSE